MKKVIFILFVLSVFTACDRTFDYKAISITEPALQVIVETVGGTTESPVYTKIEGATVKLYNNKSIYDANGTPMFSKTTDNKGSVIFTKTELAKEGVFYVRVSRNTLSGTGETKFMLLNDGVTTLYITLK